MPASSHRVLPVSSEPAVKKDEPAAKKKGARPKRAEGPRKWEEMDYGRFLSASVHVPAPGQQEDRDRRRDVGDAVEG